MATDTCAPRSHVLAIETSGRLGSVALGPGPDVLEERAFNVALNHARELLPTISGLCRDHGVSPGQIACVCVSAGPGSFTGLRVGVTCARMLALATGAATVAVPTLEVIAQNALAAAPRPNHVAVLLDAKRKRVYAALFRRVGGAVERYVAVDNPAEHDPGEFLARCPAGAAILGEGVAYHRDAVEAGGRLVLPEALNAARAGVVLELGFAAWQDGQSTPPRELTPVYVRRPEAEEVWEKRRQAECTHDGSD